MPSAAAFFGSEVPVGPLCSHCGKLTILFMQVPAPEKPGRVTQHFRCVECGSETQVLAAVFDTSGDQTGPR